MSIELEMKLRSMLQPVDKEIEDGLIEKINEESKTNPHLLHKVLLLNSGDICIGADIDKSTDYKYVSDKVIEMANSLLEA